MASARNVKKNNLVCNDCRQEIKKERDEIRNGFLLTYKANGQEFRVYKCRECFEKDPALTNYQECEVYSRVCGYLRPVAQWNKAKRKEFEERTDYYSL